MVKGKKSVSGNRRKKGKPKVKKLEKTLKETRENYRYLFEKTPAFYCIIDRDGKIHDINKSFLRAIKYNRKEVIGRKILDFIPEKYHKPALEDIKRSMKVREHSTSGFECKVFAKDGSTVWVYFSPGHGIIREDNRPGYLLISGIDITERKKAEKKLKESEERSRSLFEGMVDAVFIADPKTKKLTDCNKAAEKLMGYPRKKILSMTADQLHPKDVVKETMEAFRKQAEGKILYVETEILTKNKKRVPVAINTAPVKIGSKTYLQGVFRDITERKKTEERLKKKTQELERFNRLAVGRELRMIELKKKIKELKRGDSN